jgi:hypothetical protein
MKIEIDKGKWQERTNIESTNWEKINKFSVDYNYNRPMSELWKNKFLLQTVFKI